MSYPQWINILHSKGFIEINGNVYLAITEKRYDSRAEASQRCKDIYTEGGSLHLVVFETAQEMTDLQVELGRIFGKTFFVLKKTPQFLLVICRPVGWRLQPVHGPSAFGSPPPMSSRHKLPTKYWIHALLTINNITIRKFDNIDKVLVQHRWKNCVYVCMHACVSP